MYGLGQTSSKFGASVMTKILWLWRSCVIIGLIGLILLIVIWNGWLTPIQHIPRSVEIIILVAPLLWLVRGVLYGRNSTQVYSIILSLPYAILGVWYLLSPVEIYYGFGLLIFSTLMYLGGFFSVKIVGSQAALAPKQSVNQEK